MYLLRSFSLSKWSPNLDKDLTNFETDPITVCTRTQANQLSVWQIESFDWNAELINKIIAAFALNKDNPASLDFIFLDGDLLTQRGIEIVHNDADTPYADMNKYHKDLTALTYEKLGIVANHIVDQLKDKATHKKIERAELISLVVDIYLANNPKPFDIDTLPDKWKTAITKECIKRNITL